MGEAGSDIISWSFYSLLRRLESEPRTPGILHLNGDREHQATEKGCVEQPESRRGSVSLRVQLPRRPLDARPLGLGLTKAAAREVSSRLAPKGA